MWTRCVGEVLFVPEPGSTQNPGVDLQHDQDVTFDLAPSDIHLAEPLNQIAAAIVYIYLLFIVDFLILVRSRPVCL